MTCSDKQIIFCSTYATSGQYHSLHHHHHHLFFFYFSSIQPIYYQEPSSSATTLLTRTTTPQTLNALLPNPTGMNPGIHLTPNPSTGAPSYYELAYAATSAIDQPSYIYATTPGQAFSYAQIPTAAAATSQANNLTEVYGNHTAKYLIDDHGAPVDREHHSRATAGW